MDKVAISANPHVSHPAPFGTFAPSRGRQGLLAFAQAASAGRIGKQLSRLARSLYLWRAPLPADVTVGDLRLRCWLRDNTCERKFVFTPWRFDTVERSILANALRSGGVFVDIGANVGIYSLTAALLLGAGGRVVAIEPYPPALERLRFNLAATRGTREDWPRVDVLDVGIAEREETRELRIDAGNLGGGSLLAGAARFSQAGSNAAHTIRCRPLLAVLGDAAVDRIDVLKIDIEGTEDTALCPFLGAAPDTLLPRWLIVENSDALWRRDLRGALAERGFRQMARTRLNTVYRKVPGGQSGN